MADRAGRGRCNRRAVRPLQQRRHPMFGFLAGYGSEEGYDSGEGFWLLAGLSRVMPLPGWAERFTRPLAVVAFGGFRRLVRVRQRPDDPVAICAAAGTMMALLIFAISPHYPWYFAWLAVPCVVGPNARGAVDGHGADPAVPRHVRGPFRLAVGRLSCRPLRLAFVSLRPSLHRRADRGKSVMSTTTLKDPRRYFEAVAAHAARRRRGATGLPVSGGHQPLQSAVRDLSPHLRGPGAAGRYELGLVHTYRRPGAERRACRAARRG